jgi:hypothetical protein
MTTNEVAFWMGLELFVALAQALPRETIAEFLKNDAIKMERAAAKRKKQQGRRS